jgi:hypothetical protein
MREHRFSGYPGAWCLDCGQPDLREECIGAHPEAFGGPETSENPMGYVQHCVNPPCPEPGSDRHNPYVRTATTPGPASDDDAAGRAGR